MKYLKISPEYGTNPLWLKLDNELSENIDVSDTNFNSELKKRIAEWARLFDLTLNQDYPPDSGFQSLIDELKLEGEGYAIWKLIKQNHFVDFDKISYRSVSLNKTFTDLTEYQAAINAKL